MEWWIINDELIFHPLSIIGVLDCLWFLDRFRKTYSGPENWHGLIRQLFLLFHWLADPWPPVRLIYQIFPRGLWLLATITFWIFLARDKSPLPNCFFSALTSLRVTSCISTNCRKRKTAHSSTAWMEDSSPIRHFADCHKSIKALFSFFGFRV